ncbi:helix-turn-helix domain-containing protein [Aurantimonas endophytica]|uniref:helix-turn-helix domain-containing protein n=1 Tax=Aurantimonas endophytica TaxID=1522175 RepID=UPI003AB9A027
MMAVPVPLRPDFQAAGLRSAAQRTRDAAQARRLLALATIYEGASRADAAKIGGVTRSVARDWVIRFNAHGPDGLVDLKSPGAPSRLGACERRALLSKLENKPVPSTGSDKGLRLVDLAQWVFEEFQIIVSIQTLSRELRDAGYGKRPPRRRHTGAGRRSRQPAAKSTLGAPDSEPKGHRFKSSRGHH